MKILKYFGRAQRVVFLLLLILTFTTVNAFSKETELDYNTYYRFPLSIGVEYQSLSPFGDYGSNFHIYEIAAYLRWPIPSIPVLQPTLRLGIMYFDSQDSVDPEEWDHQHYYGALGILYSNRFSKNFEIGAEIFGGYSQAVFPNLIPEEEDHQHYYGALGIPRRYFQILYPKRKRQAHPTSYLSLEGGFALTLPTTSALIFIPISNTLSLSVR